MLRGCMLRALPSNGRCLQSRRLATGIYATLISPIQSFSSVLNEKWSHWVHVLHFRNAVLCVTSLGPFDDRLCLLYLSIYVIFMEGFIQNRSSRLEKGNSKNHLLQLVSQVTAPIWTMLIKSANQIVSTHFCFGLVWFNFGYILTFVYVVKSFDSLWRNSIYVSYTSNTTR
jgi:hypothetical protein